MYLFYYIICRKSVANNDFNNNNRNNINLKQLEIKFS